MSTFTENYDLIKPDEGDYFDVQDFNENFDAIDGQMALTEQEIAGVHEKIGTPAESGQTIFSLLNHMEIPPLIKSIQRVFYHNKNTGKTLSINTVDPARCVVLMERIYDNYDAGRPYVDYTLSSDLLTISNGTGSYSTNVICCGFWIIEFH